jgi:alpha-beta hydrolase superfamily lysophospholipase
VPESNVPESSAPPAGTIADVVRAARTEPAIVPELAAKEMIAADGTPLPLRTWLPEGKVRATIVALHGMNDYSRAFDGAAKALAWRGVATYAYDQRGFGEAPWRGLWVGRRTLAEDLATATRLVKAQHPGVPLYCLGESMGGAVVIVAVAGETGAEKPLCDGVILSAPAVWGRTTQPFLPRAALAVAVRLFPEAAMTGRGLQIKASDNVAMLRELGRDPLVIKGARVDTLYGLADLMDAALASTARLDPPTLYLYGNRDEVVPKNATRRAIGQMPRERQGGPRVAWYVNGYHLLLRDLEAGVVINDIASWIFDPGAPLPSAADGVAAMTLAAASRSP